MIVLVKDILCLLNDSVVCYNMWKSIFRIFVELLYPYTCIFCKKQLNTEEAICTSCAQTVPVVRSISPDKVDCDYLDAIFIFTKYHDGAHNALQKIKFGRGKKNILFLARFMETIWTESAKDFFYFSYLPHATNCSVIPIPTDNQRMRKRGYDLPTELFQIWCMKENFHWQPILKRFKYTKPQFALSKLERVSNIKNSMELVGVVEYSTVILVDDIFTTGATMNEAAKVLKKAGVQKIIAVAFSGDYAV